MRQQKKIIFLIIFIVLGILLSAKMLFFGLTPDEEYQITMSYRVVQGDGLFYKSWDTIQTSGFLNYFLIKVFLLLGSANGIVMFLRMCGLVFQLITACAIYRRIKRILPYSEALVIAAFAFMSYPKIFATPDFSNMLFWFLALMLCFLWDAYESYVASGKPNYCKLVLAAMMMSASILSQACFILIPITFFLLFSLFPNRKVKASFVFWGTCVLLAVIYVSGIILCNGLDNILLAVKGILGGDITHGTGANITGQSVYITYAKNVVTILIWLTFSALIAAGISFVSQKLIKTGTYLSLFMIIWNSISGLVTLYFWFIKKTGYDGLKLYIPCMLCIALIYWIRAKRNCLERKCPIPFYGVLLGIGVFINVLFISNVPLINNLSFLIPSVLWGMILIASSANEEVMPHLTLFLITTFIAAAGTMFTLQSSPAGVTVFDCDARILEGPAKGVYTSQYVADVYNSECSSFKEIVPDNSTVLIVTNYYNNTLLYYCYLENNVNISHYSVNSTPTFLQILEGYWVIYPDKYPDVIVVNNSTVYTVNDDWIFYYIEYYYGYSRVVQTEYATYYFK